MYTTHFIIPKAVYFYCILPAVVIIVASIIFSLIYHKKKGTFYYIYTLNYVYNIASILLCLLLFPLLFGYSLAMIYIIREGIVASVNFLVIVMLVILPTIPLATLIFVSTRFFKNLKYKEQLDERHNDLEEEIN